MPNRYSYKVFADFTHSCVISAAQISLNEVKMLLYSHQDCSNHRCSELCIVRNRCNGKHQNVQHPTTITECLSHRIVQSLAEFRRCGLGTPDCCLVILRLHQSFIPAKPINVLYTAFSWSSKDLSMGLMSLDVSSGIFWKQASDIS